MLFRFTDNNHGLFPVTYLIQKPSVERSTSVVTYAYLQQRTDVSRFDLQTNNSQIKFKIIY